MLVVTVAPYQDEADESSDGAAATLWTFAAPPISWLMRLNSAGMASPAISTIQINGSTM